MRRLLLVTYAFPPILTAEAINVGRTVSALDDLGWRTSVLTVDPRSVEGRRDEGLSEGLPRSLEIHTAPSPEGAFRRPRRAPLRVMLHAGLPEEQLLWYPAALRLGREVLTRERFDAMLSWSSYHTSNVVGLGLRRRSAIPWVAHSSDPWTRSPYFPRRPLQRAVARALEHAIFRRADALTFTTRETVDLVMAGLPSAWRAKATVVPHGYDLVGERSARRPAGGPLRLVHTGQFYKGKRTPLALLAAIAHLQKTLPLAGRLEVVFVGPTVREYETAARDMGVAGLVRFDGPRSVADARRAAEEADVLVVIDAPSRGPSVFLPTKVVDYLALGRPILGLTPRVGATADLLRRTGDEVVEPDDPTAIAEALRIELEAYEASGRVPPAPPAAQDDVARDYEIHRTTERLVRVLERITESPASRAP